MVLHLIKLCVGVGDIEELAAWQQARLAERRKAGEPPRIWHTTFQTPKREAELLDGGSIYWVIKGSVQVRQGLVGFEAGTKSDGSKGCRILLDPLLVPVRPVPRRAFQGWRYPRSRRRSRRHRRRRPGARRPSRQDAPRPCRALPDLAAPCHPRACPEDPTLRLRRD